MIPVQPCPVCTVANTCTKRIGRRQAVRERKRTSAITVDTIVRPAAVERLWPCITAKVVTSIEPIIALSTSYLCSTPPISSYKALECNADHSVPPLVTHMPQYTRLTMHILPGPTLYCKSLRLGGHRPQPSVFTTER